MRRHTVRQEENPLRALRKSLGYSERDMADLLEKSSMNTYSYKERGLTSFAPHEMAIIAKEFKMTDEDFNTIFFKGELHLRSRFDITNCFNVANDADRKAVIAILEKYATEEVG